MKNNKQPLIERLKTFHSRCLEVSGGVKAVASAMNVNQNTLHNWFSGRTTPTPDDLLLLRLKLEEKERITLEEKKALQDRLETIFQSEVA